MPGGRMLLVGGAGPAPLGIDIGLAVIEQAASLGLSTHIIGHAPDLEYTRAVCDRADSVTAVDFEDVPTAVAWALEQERRGAGFDVVFTVREVALAAAAAIARALGLPGNAPEAVELVRTKDRCRQRLADCGFVQPRVVLCRSAADAHRACVELGGRVVVKPRDGSGSEGVSLVADPAQLADAIALLPDPGVFLVEEFVEGEEFSVEGLFRSGRPEILAITTKQKLAPPLFVEIGASLPAPLADADRDRVTATVLGALAVTGLSFGLFHVELWLTRGTVVMGELHARLGGDYIHRMLAHAIEDLQMFREVLEDALGVAGPTPVRRRCLRAGANRYLTPPPGVVRRVEGWEEVRAHPAVLTTELTVGPGDRTAACRSSDDRVGAIIVGADTSEDAAALAQRLAASVAFTVD